MLSLHDALPIGFARRRLTRTPRINTHFCATPELATTKGAGPMGDATVTSGPNIALLWRGQAAEWTHRFHEARQWPIMQALRALGATARPVLYRDEAVRAIRDELLSCAAEIGRAHV